MLSSALGGELIGCIKDGGGAGHQIADAEGGMTQEVTAHDKRRA